MSSSSPTSLRLLLPLALLLLPSTYLVSLDAIPISRLNKLPSKDTAQMFVPGAITLGDIKGDGDKIEKKLIEGRMEIELNDYGATTSNPVHTPRPPN